MKSQPVLVLLLLFLIGICPRVGLTVCAQKSEPVATRLAELNDESYEMYCSVLDTFIDRLKQDKTLHGAIIVYGPDGKLFGTRSRILQEVTLYMNAVGKLSPDPVTIIDGGVSNRAPWSTTELWIVPTGAKMPEVIKRPEPTTDFSGRVGYMIGAQSDDDIEYDFPSSYGASMAAFSQILGRQRNSVGYLIVHRMSGNRFSNWRGIARYGITVLKRYGVDPARVKIIHGETASYPNAELWILSKGEHLPPLK